MARFAFLLVNVLLFALSPAHAKSSTDEAQVISHPNGYQLAQSAGRCESYGKANNCKARWDIKTRSCSCV